jgi:N utilization substance protein B
LAFARGLYCLVAKCNKSNSFYQEYMNNQVLLKKTDNLLGFIYGSYCSNENYMNFLEDDKLTWIDDIPMVNTHIIKQLKAMKPIGG